MNIKIMDALNLFLMEQEMRGNTELTISTYKKSLGFFIEHIGADKSTYDIDMGVLNGYHLYMKKKKRYEGHEYIKSDKPINSITLQSYIRRLRAFLNWLYGEGYLENNLAEKFKLPKAEKKLIDILTYEEMEKLLNKYKRNTEMSVRNACIIALMLDSGLRVGEVVGLDYDNVNLAQGIVKVFGKGQKERLVPIGTYTKKMLYKYIMGYRSMPDYESKSLFISKDKKPLTYDCVKMLFVRLRKSVGIERLYPHLLRHTFATNYLINGGDIISLQQILGHESLEMVRRYSHLASAHVLHIHKKFSPIDNLISLRYDAKKNKNK